jgi:hypothetical protein
MRLHLMEVGSFVLVGQSFNPEGEKDMVKENRGQRSK